MIRVEKLTKYFDKFCAIKELSFEVGAGEIFGFIGPNGAGKTTTIRILATLSNPDGGSAFIDGLDVVNEPERVRRLIGYMPDYFGVYEGVTVWEFLDFFAAAYSIPRHRRRQIVADCMALTELTGIAEKMVSALSKGMKQRLCLAKTLVHDPQVLLLDEPAAGLDPRARIEIRALLKELASMGKTILLSSHILTELADIVSSVGIIEKGQLITSGRPEDIARRLSPHRALEIHTIGPEETQRAAEVLSQTALAQVQEIQCLGKTLRLNFTGEEREIYLVLKVLVNADVAIIGLGQEERNLEAIFMKVTDGELR